MSLRLEFYCRQGKITKDGTAKIEMSVNYNGVRKVVTLPRRCKPSEFKKSKEIKEYLNTTENKVWNDITELTKMGLAINTDLVCDTFFNGLPKEKVYTVGDLFDDYWQVLALKDKAGKFTLNNWNKYNRAKKAFFNYINKEKALTELTRSDIEEFQLKLLAQGLKDTTVGQYLTKIKTVILYGMNNGKISVNPMYGIKIAKNVEEIKIIDTDEYNRIRVKQFDIERIDKVRDAFIFACGTGLAYCDVCDLTPSDFKEVEGRYIINKKRQKTGVEFYSVVLPDAMEILKKYNFDLSLLQISNQKMNAYLKEIQDLCAVTSVDSLHFHLARHYYITTLVRMGVPTNIVCRCAGHSSEKMSRKYQHLVANDIVNIVSSKM